jgi:hypothetical protein
MRVSYCCSCWKDHVRGRNFDGYLCLETIRSEINIDDALSDSTRSTPLELPSRRMPASTFRQLQSTNKLRMHFVFKDTSIHVRHEAPCGPSQHWQSYQMLSRPSSSVALLRPSPCLEMSAMLDNDNCVDRVATPCGNRQHIKIPPSIEAHACFRHMQSAELRTHVISCRCTLSLLFWNATVSPVDKWRTTDQAWWPSRLLKATGQHQAPIPAPSRDYCGGVLLKIFKEMPQWTLCQPTGTSWDKAGPLLSWVPGTPWQESASGLIRASGGFYIPDIGM